MNAQSHVLDLSIVGMERRVTEAWLDSLERNSDVDLALGTGDVDLDRRRRFMDVRG